jgi:4-hydroxy-tetrahydrodipicolinate synthase
VDSPWRGLVPYLPTPVDDAGRLRTDVLAELVDHVLRADVAAICPLGSTGEAALLDQATRDAVVRETVRAAGATPVIAGVVGTGLASVVDQVRRARGHGAAGILLALRAYFPLTEGEVLGAVESVVLAAAPLPVVLYVHPEWCGVVVRPRQAERLVDLGVAAVKDASGSADPAAWRRGAPGLAVYAATASDPVTALEHGACGLMSGPASVVPLELAQLIALVDAGRASAARAVADRLGPVLDLFRRRGAPRAVKALLVARGFDVGEPIPPLAPLSREERQEATVALRHIA